MKSLSMEEFETLVEDIVKLTSDDVPKHVAAAIVRYVLERIEHDSMQLDPARKQAISWLRCGHSLSSWLGYNKEKELALSIALPQLYQLMLAQTASTTKLKAAEDAVRETPDEA